MVATRAVGQNGRVSTARDHPPEEAAEDSSFARGLRLLLVVADRGAIRADELATLLDMPQSTAYRYLRTLTEFGFVDRQDGRYRLGPKLVIGSGSHVTSDLLIRLSEPVLRTLVESQGETAVVLRRVGLAAMCLHQHESRHGIRVALEPGATYPLHAGAGARVLLSFAPDDIVEEILAQGLEALTPTTPSETPLRKSLAEIKRNGIAFSEGELIDGSVSVAVPVFRDDGIVGALALWGPYARCGSAWKDRAAGALERAARSLTAELETDGS
jgi:IclR family transcriptional regulator, acetate operon repressor